MDSCIYCKIIEGEIPCDKVYEDDNILAFLDIRPISPGHTIVISKKHHKDMESLPADVLFDLMSAVKQIGQALLKGLDVKGYSIFLDNKSDANQHVPHVHFHIVPRAKGDGLDRWPQQERYAENEAPFIAQKIKMALI